MDKYYDIEPRKNKDKSKDKTIIDAMYGMPPEQNFDSFEVMSQCASERGSINNVGSERGSVINPNIDIEEAVSNNVDNNDNKDGSNSTQHNEDNKETYNIEEDVSMKILLE